MHLADNTGSDQPAHKRRLIRASIVCLQNQWILLYMSPNGECSDQTACMHMLICTYAVSKFYKGLFCVLHIIYLN